MSNAITRIQSAMVSHQRHYGHEAQQLVIGDRVLSTVMDELGAGRFYSCHSVAGDQFMGLEVVRDRGPEVCYLVSRGQRGELYASAT